MPVFPALRMLKQEDPKSEKCMEIFLLFFVRQDLSRQPGPKG